MTDLRVLTVRMAGPEHLFIAYHPIHWNLELVSGAVTVRFAVTLSYLSYYRASLNNFELNTECSNILADIPHAEREFVRVDMDRTNEKPVPDTRCGLRLSLVNSHTLADSTPSAELKA